MRILFTTTVPGTLGFTVRVVEKLRADGHQVSYVADLSGRNCPEGISPITSIPMSRAMTPTRDLISLIRWVIFLKRSKPEILITGTAKASLLSLLAARLVRVPNRVYIIHGALWDGGNDFKCKILRIIEKLNFNNSTTQISVSESLSRQIVDMRISETMPKVPGKGSVAGVDILKFRPSLTGKRHSPVRLAYIGRLARDKNIDSLLSVYDLAKNTANQEIELHIYGSLDYTAPPPMETQLRINEEAGIIYHGYSSDVVQALNSVDILVFPSSREGLPQVVLEAQACGVPVVAWSCTGVVDAVSPGAKELLTAIGDISGMVTSVTSLITDDRLANDLSLEGRKWVEKNFDQEVVADTVKNLIIGSASN